MLLHKNRTKLENDQLLPQLELILTHYLIQWKQSSSSHCPETEAELVLWKDNTDVVLMAKGKLFSKEISVQADRKYNLLSAKAY